MKLQDISERKEGHNRIIFIQTVRTRILGTCMEGYLNLRTSNLKLT
jgi:hypothetical protein